MAGNDSTAVATGIFGGMTLCCICCLFIFGIPMLITGICLVIYGWWLEGLYITGIIFIVLASLMALVGIIAGILTAVYGTKTVNNMPPPTSQPATIVIAPTVFTTSTSSQPVGYHHTQPQPGAPATYSQPMNQQHYQQQGVMYPPPYPAFAGQSSDHPPPAYNPGAITVAPAQQKMH